MLNETTEQPAVEQPAVEQPAVESAPPAQLQISDILAAAQVINLASQRGAFKPEEFTQVGAIYDRIVAFLKDSGALQPAPASTSDTPAEETPAA